MSLENLLKIGQLKEHAPRPERLLTLNPIASTEKVGGDFLAYQGVGAT